MSYEGADRRQRTRPEDYEARIMSKAELRDTFREVGEEIITAFCSQIGVDASKPESLAEMGRRLEWVGNVKAASELAARSAVKAVVGIIATAIVGSITVAYYAMKTKLGWGK
jgi:hypothetical protein